MSRFGFTREPELQSVNFNGVNTGALESGSVLNGTISKTDGGQDSISDVGFDYYEEGFAKMKSAIVDSPDNVNFTFDTGATVQRFRAKAKVNNTWYYGTWNTS